MIDQVPGPILEFLVIYQRELIDDENQIFGQLFVRILSIFIKTKEWHFRYEKPESVNHETGSYEANLTIVDILDPVLANKSYRTVYGISSNIVVLANNSNLPKGSEYTVTARVVLKN